MTAKNVVFNTQKSFDAKRRATTPKFGIWSLVNLRSKEEQTTSWQKTTLSAENKKLKAFSEKLERDNAVLKQKIAGLGIDMDSNSARLSDTEAS